MVSLRISCSGGSKIGSDSSGISFEVTIRMACTRTARTVIILKNVYMNTGLLLDLVRLIFFFNYVIIVGRDNYMGLLPFVKAIGLSYVG